MSLKPIWRNHSLSIVMISAGLAIMAASFPLREGTWFDLISMVGGGLFTAGVVFAAQGPLRERNRPEDPPD